MGESPILPVQKVKPYKGPYKIRSPTLGNLKFLGEAGVKAWKG